MAGYKVRRGARPDFMQQDPTLGDHDVIAIVDTPVYADPEPPPSGGIYYYVISSVSERGRESFEPRASREW